MANPYSKVFRTVPGSWKFSSSGALARLPMSMVGISIVLMLHAWYDGQYGIGGRVSATYIIAQAICAPQLAKLVDRFGQRKIMLPSTIASGLLLTSLGFAAYLRTSEWVLHIFAILVGATIGSVGAMVRARWSAAITDSKQLHTAFSFESAVDELIFVIGPVLATILATNVYPPAGVIIAVAAMLVGGTLFFTQVATQPAPSPKVAGEKTKSAIRNPGMIPLVAIFITVGIIFGASDVATLAFAEEHHKDYLGGVILAFFALGSLISGLGYGARHWRSPLWKRLVIGLLGMAAGVSLFVFANSLPVLTAVMFLTGFAIAPTIINGNNMVQFLVSPKQLTEGLTWLGTGLGGGVSLGMSVGGMAVDEGGSHAGFQLVIAAAALAVVIVLAAIMPLKRQVAKMEELHRLEETSQPETD